KPNVRQRLGLNKRPLFDPDVRAGRLSVADSYLARILYQSPRPHLSLNISTSKTKKSATGTITSKKSAWDIAKDKYKSASTIYLFPDGRIFRGDQIKNWKTIPVGTKITLGG
ncbi:hypothetical protein H8D64_00175, partial [PVC group bacterium]|nr:hypothetical protein [PVC group bacterium]